MIRLTLVFSSVALFNMFRTPLKQLPKVISDVSEAVVSLDRVRDFLLAPEMEDLPCLVEEDFALRVSGGEFAWENHVAESLSLKKVSGPLKRVLSRKKADSKKHLFVSSIDNTPLSQPFLKDIDIEKYQKEVLQ